MTKRPKSYTSRANCGLANALVASELKSEPIFLVISIDMYLPCISPRIPVIPTPPLFMAQMQANDHPHLINPIILIFFTFRSFLDVSDSGMYLNEARIYVGGDEVAAAHEHE